MTDRRCTPEQLAAVIDQLDHGILIHDQNERLVYCNAAAESLLKPSQDQLSGLAPLPPGWHVDLADDALLAIAIDTAGQADTSGTRPEAALTCFRDQGLRRQLEARLKASEERFRELAENIDLVFWIGSPDWRNVDYVSPAYEKIWQRSRASLLDNGMNWFEAVVEEDRQAILATLNEYTDSDWQSISFPPYRIRLPDGGMRWISARAFPIRDSAGRIERVAGIAEDISARQQQQKSLEELAHLDALTRLPNRTLLADRMQQAMARSRRTGQMLAICLLDLDGFKPVNDQFGHKAGDDLLIQLAGRLTQAVRADDTVARLGGDEFVLLLGSLNSAPEAEDALYRLLRVIAMPFRLGEQTARVSASIGVTLYPNDAGDADSLLRHADHAMYLAKEGGKNQFHLFNPTLEIRDRENRAAMKRIEEALLNDQFMLYYQPIVDCRRGLPTGAEALIRWDHPILGVLTPNEFLPLIEGHDRLALEVGSWAIEAAIGQADAWRRDGLDLSVSINVFPQQFRDLDFSNRLDAILAKYPDLPRARITLEIIESSALEDIVSASRLMRDGDQLGLRYALDDFGTGYSSMTYLRRLPVHVLKIDQSFVHDMLTDPEDLAIIEAIIGLATAFRHRVIAEGAESLEQILMLTELGCHYIQGFALARPMPASQIPAWLAGFQPDPRWRANATQHLSRDDFQLVLAEVHHRQWLNQILAWQRHADPKHAEPPALDETQCNFGHWQLGEGELHYGHLSEFQAMAEPHARVHALARTLVAPRPVDRDATPDPLWESGLQAASQAFIDALVRLRRVVGHRDSRS